MSSNLYLRPKWFGENGSTTLLHRIRSSTTVVILIVSALIWLFGYQYFSFASARDPTSYFFNPAKGYERRYSLEREREAYAYIEQHNQSDAPGLEKTAKQPQLCLGVATIARPSDQYVVGTIGSLLAGLSGTEREDLHLITFIAHTDPADHPIYSHPWTKAISNEVLTYNVPSADMERLKIFETEHHPRNKSMYDYGYLLRNCLSSGAPYIAIVEDDVIAREGWYAIMKYALQTIKDRMGSARWLYMRMFYTESLFGWNSEEWLSYLTISLTICVASFTILSFAASRVSALRNRLARPDAALLSFVCIPAFIILYFMAGRVTMRPLKPGVTLMSRFGCCSQGFIFPQAVVHEIVERTDQAMEEDLYIDMLLERYAEKADLPRFAYVPSLLQHVGSKSSKGGGYDEHAGEIFNFGFERKPP